ncbi:MAG TPA: amidohydrolase family protein [Candidatus Binatia bacterium]
MSRHHDHPTNEPEFESCDVHDDDAVYDNCGERIPGLSRRKLLARAAGLAAATPFATSGLLGLLGKGSEAEAAGKLPLRGREPAKRGTYLIRGGYVVSMDDTIGNIPDADVLVRDGVILEIGKGLRPRGAQVIDASRMIVIPGFVDTHWHVWNGLQRNLLAPGFEYFPAKTATAPHYTPEDFYNSDMLSFMEAFNAGITTVNNYAHNTRTTEHVEAELQAHLDAGIRGRYNWSTIDGQPGNVPLPIDEIRRIHAKWFSSSSPFEGLTDLGIGFRNPASNIDTFNVDTSIAVELGLPLITHSGQSARGIDATQLRSLGFLGPKTILVHYVHATSEDRAAMAETGASLSYSIHSELRLGTRGNQQEQILRMVADGVNVSLSCDANSLGPISHFQAMNVVYNIGIPWLGTTSEELPALTFRDVLKMATINGAVAMGLGDVTGSLTPGKRADIACVRADDLNMVPAADPECALVMSASVANVDTVLCDGRLVKRGGKILRFPIDTIIRRAARSAFVIRMRAGGRLTPPTTTPPAF